MVHDCMYMYMCVCTCVHVQYVCVCGAFMHVWTRVYVEGLAYASMWEHTTGRHLDDISQTALCVSITMTYIEEYSGNSGPCFGTTEDILSRLCVCVCACMCVCMYVCICVCGEERG